MTAARCRVCTRGCLPGPVCPASVSYDGTEDIREALSVDLQRMGLLPTVDNGGHYCGRCVGCQSGRPYDCDRLPAADDDRFVRGTD